MKRAKAYIKVVLANNPGASAQVFERPDVQYILQQSALKAYSRVNPMIDKAALTGALLGSKIDGSRNSKFQQNSVLASLHKDLEKIAAQFPQGIGDIIKAHGDEYDLDSAFKRFALRVDMVAEAAVKMNYSLSVIATMRGTDTLKMWQATSDKPCKFCVELDGQKRDWDEPFVLKSVFPVYGKSLFGPQLHPNCRCILAILPRTAKNSKE